MPDKYGLHDLLSQEEIRHSQVKGEKFDYKFPLEETNLGFFLLVTEYFKGKNWKVNQDFVYCEYNSLKDLDKDGETSDSNFRDHEDMFDTPEEQILHFLDRASAPGWKWRSVS